MACTRVTLNEPFAGVVRRRLWLLSVASVARRALSDRAHLLSMAAATDDPTWLAWQRLAETTVRLFYGLPEVFVIKVLLHAPHRFSEATGLSHPEYQAEEAIAERLKLSQVYVRTMLQTLEQDRIIKACRPKAKAAAGEEKLAAANQSALTAGSVQVSWGIDFEELADAVTFKLDEMERKLGEQKGSDLQTYRCPQCKLAISELDVDFNALLTANGGLACPSRSPACFGHELEVEDTTVSVAKIEVHRAALRVHTAQLQQCLRDVSELHPPLYIRPLPKAERDEDEAAAAEAAAARGGRAGAGGTGGGESSGSQLGASKGIAEARGSALLAPVPWMQTAGEAAAARAAMAANEAASGAAQQAVSAAAAEESAAWEREYLQRHRESERRASSSTVAGGGALSVEPVAPMEEELEDEEEGEGEEVMVMVAGMPMAFSTVTESDMQRMSDTEYQRYYELCNE